VSVLPSDFDILAPPSMPGRRLTSLSSAVLQDRRRGQAIHFVDDLIGLFNHR
jgi:hypothetical protein